MSLFNRAWLYISRKKVRSLLLLLVMLLASVFAMLGLAVKHSADIESAAIRKSLGSSFTIKENGDAIRALMANYENGYIPLEERPRQPDIEMMEDIRAMDHIDDYFASVRAPVWLDLQLLPGSWNDTYRKLSENPDMETGLPFETIDVYRQQNDIYGCISTEMHENFRNGAFSLVQGQHITLGDQFKILISTALAERNGLSVGDTVTVEIREGVHTFGGDMYTVWGEPIVLHIAGLFSVNFPQEPTIITDEYGNEDVYTLEHQLVDNMIFSDMTTTIHINAVIRAHYLLYRDNKPIDPVAVENVGIEDESFGSVTFFVDDPKNLNAAIAEVRSLDEIDKNYFDIFPDDSAYKASVKPLNTIGTVSAVLISAVVIGCAVILGLLLNMWVKARRHEMGVLMSIGISRRTIIAQLLLETGTLSILALMLAASLASLLAGSVGNIAEILVSPKRTSDTYTVGIEMIFPVVNKVSAEPVDLTYSLTGQNILITAIVIVASTVGTVMASAWNVLKLNPKHVLTRH